MNEQLHDLRSSMLKYEDVVAENGKIRESNAILTQQLEAQLQKCSRLNAKVEHLQQVEIGLKRWSSELERDLSSMKIATDSSRSEMSALEQVNHDLRERLKEIENELVTTKAKADDVKESRKNLEIQATEYKVTHIFPGQKRSFDKL